MQARRSEEVLQSTREPKIFDFSSFWVFVHPHSMCSCWRGETLLPVRGPKHISSARIFCKVCVHAPNCILLFALRFKCSCFLCVASKGTFYFKVLMKWSACNFRMIFTSFSYLQSCQFWEYLYSVCLFQKSFVLCLLPSSLINVLQRLMRSESCDMRQILTCHICSSQHDFKEVEASVWKIRSCVFVTALQAVT